MSMIMEASDSNLEGRSSFALEMPAQNILEEISDSKISPITKVLKRKSQNQSEGSKTKKVKLIITSRKDELERQEQLQQQQQLKKRGFLDNPTKGKKAKASKAIKTKNEPEVKDFSVHDFLEEDSKSKDVETETFPSSWAEQPIIPQYDYKDEIKDEPEALKDDVKTRPRRKVRAKKEEYELEVDQEEEFEFLDDPYDDYNPDREQTEEESEHEDFDEEERSDVCSDEDEDNRPLRSRQAKHRKKIYQTCLSDPSEVELSMTPENVAKFGGDPKGEPLIKFPDGRLSALYLDQYCLSKSMPEESLQKEEQEEENDKVFGCPFCDFSGIKNNWLGHLKLRHKDKGLIYCAWGQSCYMPFQDKDLLKKHADAEHFESENACPTCGKLFKWPSSLRNHMQSHLKEGDQKKHMFICPFCGKKFNTRTGFRSHEAIYHTKNLRHNCDWSGCDKKFYNASDLVIHKRTHTGELPYTCSYCGNGFVSKSRMMQHERQMHLGVEKAVSNPHSSSPVRSIAVIQSDLVIKDQANKLVIFSLLPSLNNGRYRMWSARFVITR